MGVTPVLALIVATLVPISGTLHATAVFDGACVARLEMAHFHGPWATTVALSGPGCPTVAAQECVGEGWLASGVDFACADAEVSGTITVTRCYGGMPAPPYASTWGTVELQAAGTSMAGEVHAVLTGSASASTIHPDCV